MAVKRAPERWQDNRDVFDAVITFDERIMEQLLDGDHLATLHIPDRSQHYLDRLFSCLFCEVHVEFPPQLFLWIADFNGRPQSTMKPLLVINIVSALLLAERLTMMSRSVLYTSMIWTS